MKSRRQAEREPKAELMRECVRQETIVRFWRCRLMMFVGIVAFGTSQVLADEFVVGDMRVEGLQRISDGRESAVLPHIPEITFRPIQTDTEQPASDPVVIDMTQCCREA